MKIVIDISDKMFDTFKKHGIMTFDNLDEYDRDMIADAIANGTPLPAGHGDLIDINTIECIMLEDSLVRMVHTKGDEVDWYIEAPIIVEADK